MPNPKEKPAAYTTAKILKPLSKALAIEAVKQEKDKQELLDVVIRAGMHKLGIPTTV